MEFNKWKEAAIEGVLEKQIFKSSYGKCSMKRSSYKFRKIHSKNLFQIEVEGLSLELC